MKDKMCTHRWRRVHEESLFGGSFPIGWQCTNCDEYKENSQLTPEGLGGIVTKEHELIGIHGGKIHAPNLGKVVRKQILYEDGTLEYIQ